MDIFWPCTATDSWLMDAKANLAEICAGGLSVSLLLSAPFTGSTVVLLPLWEWGAKAQMWPVRQLYLHQEEPVGAEDVLTAVGMEK